MKSTQELDETFIMHTVKRLPIAIDHAHGNYLHDMEGNTYLDLFTGLGVNTLGHSHPRLMETLVEQGKRFLHISNLFLNSPAISLAQRLVENTVQDGKVYFCNSGAEATEAAIKLIHKWSKTYAPDRHGIIVYTNGFHGRTLGAVRLTRQSHIYQDFPELNYPVFEATTIEQLEDICHAEKPAAALFEPILGAGGVHALSHNFLLRAQELCQEHGMLFALDEIQTGIGRTGSLFAYQHEDLPGLHPDLILFAKGIGGGLPLGGIIANHKAADVFGYGDHGTTFAPSPLSAALGNTVLDLLLEEGLLEKGRLAAQELWAGLHMLQGQFPEQITTIQGRGMMIGIRTQLTAEQVTHIQSELLKHGILVDIAAKTVIRLLPPLTLQKSETKHFLTTIREVLLQLA
ncbi:aspartate aminotransferase family protein [Thermoactinomyces sp. DSM 45892]|uniref:aspartate aminotransferase family protein n=1 Tax=Thermoactinomyces sp. DSM 45892 TaxID=1882753 RepID=UPI00089A77ED|nr:aminotransferase class III-fold pyridoxal phosphate-dependent enzyme [Thermoactinomyces sp. DSM 45892]SDZ29148.1 acetylornithine aminotransferase [Thermoactinomyces sp. DSM 45892]